MSRFLSSSADGSNGRCLAGPRCAHTRHHRQPRKIDHCTKKRVWFEWESLWILLIISEMVQARFRIVRFIWLENLKTRKACISLNSWVFKHFKQHSTIDNESSPACKIVWSYFVCKQKLFWGGNDPFGTFVLRLCRIWSIGRNLSELAEEVFLIMKFNALVLWQCCTVFTRVTLHCWWLCYVLSLISLNLIIKVFPSLCIHMVDVINVIIV